MFFKGPFGDFADQMFKLWEKAFSEFMDKLVRNQTFLTTVGKSLEQNSQIRVLMDKTMERALESMRLPTRSEIEAVLHALHKLELAQAEAREELRAIREEVEALGERLGGERTDRTAGAPTERPRKRRGGEAGEPA